MASVEPGIDEPSTLLIRAPHGETEVADAWALLGSAYREMDADQAAELLVVFDAAAGGVVGALVAIRRCQCTFELSAWAVRPDLEPSASLAIRLVRAIGDALRRSGALRVVAPIAGVADSRLRVLRAVGFDTAPNTPHDLVLEL
jgi:hypothetical protein